MDRPGLVISNADDGVDRQHGGKCTDSRGKRAQNALLGARIAVVSIERVADEASITGLGTKQPDLSLKLHRRRRQQWNAEPHAGVTDGKSRGEIVAAVDHQAMIADQVWSIVGVQPLLDRIHRDEPVEPMRELCRHFGLRVSYIPLTKERLPLQVGQLDDIGIDNRELANAGPGKRGNHGAPDSPRADNRNACRLQLTLADTADLRQDNVTRVSFELGVGKVHRPVEPKPPAPRTVSLKLFTSWNAALSTGAGTSWAIRSPRLTSNGSPPILARMTFTSPR